MRRLAKKEDKTGGLREQQKEFTRRRLAAAAAQVFDREGYVNARIEDIVAEAGASRATFYLHFNSKAEVIRELMLPLVEDAAPYYAKLPELEDPSWQDIRDWLDHLMDHWKDNRAEISAVQQGVIVEPELAADFVAAVRNTVEVLTPWLAESAGIDRELANLRATLWLFEIERVGFFWRIRDVPFDGEAVLDILADSMWTALHPIGRSIKGAARG